MEGPVYALNLFNVSNKEEYLAYSRRSAREVQNHGGKVVAHGRRIQGIHRNAVGFRQSRPAALNGPTCENAA